MGLLFDRGEPRSSRIDGAGESFVAPNRVAPSLLYALRASHAGEAFTVRPDDAGARGRCFHRAAHAALLTRVRSWLA